MTEALDYSICDLAQKYADAYSEKPRRHLASDAVHNWSV